LVRRYRAAVEAIAEASDNASDEELRQCGRRAEQSGYVANNDQKLQAQAGKSM
jgi:CHAD domain-containing protein